MVNNNQVSNSYTCSLFFYKGYSELAYPLLRNLIYKLDNFSLQKP